jgi:hypothetical protein
MTSALFQPIPQDPLYHLFADRRTLFGIPNFWNVVSNIPFFLAAFWGCRVIQLRTSSAERWERLAFAMLVAGTAMVGAGSTYYHLDPCDSRLFWDRLPMTIVFMCLLALTIHAGRQLLFPLILTGLGSVIYWRFSGDLRLYALVQFGCLLAVPALLIFVPSRYTGSAWVWGTLALYVVAKLAEMFDQQISQFITMGGHPLKHFAAAGAILVYEIGISRRRLQAYR